MTFQQLLDSLIAQDNVKAIYKVENYGNEPQYNNEAPAGSTTNKYIVHILDAYEADNRCLARQIQVYVYNLGQADEAAYINPQTPEQTKIRVPDAIAEAIDIYVTQTIGSEQYEVVSYDADKKFAVVDVWEKTATEASLTRYLVYRDSGSTLHRTVV